MSLVSYVHVGTNTTLIEPLSIVALGQQLRELDCTSADADNGILGISNICAIPVSVRIAGKVRSKYI